MAVALEYFLYTQCKEVEGNMKWVGLIMLMCMSLSSWCSPCLSDRPVRDSAAVAERKQAKQIAKIERQRLRIMKKWDERSMQQKRTDRRAIIFLVISAGILANSISHKE